jgi:membrane protein DedA with SNARE-associated domain
MIPGGTAAFLSIWGYPAYFALFVASALGSPITEDVLLVVGGYLIGAGVFRWPLTLSLAYAGVVGADFLLYTFGRRLRAHTLRRGALRRFIRPGRLRIATRWFARYGDRLVFLSRLTPGTRLVVFVSAGVRGMPASRFLVYDALASLIWVPLLLWVGESLGERIGGFNAALAWIADRIFWVVIAVIVVLIARHVWISRSAKRTADEEVL